MDNALLTDIASFLLGLCVFFFSFPTIKAKIYKKKHDKIMNTRLFHIAKDISNMDMADIHTEDIGLGKKGNLFDQGSLLNSLVEYNKEEIDKMLVLLKKAGKREDNALREFLYKKILYIVAMSIFIFAFLTSKSLDIYPGLLALGSILMGIILGHQVTNMLLEGEVAARQDLIQKGIPDLIDLFVICSESGLDLNTSIRRIAKEMRSSNIILAEEMSLTSIELEMITDSKQVFENLENRIDSPLIKSLSKTLSQSIEYGSSLGASLRELSVESKNKRMMDAEGKAAQAPTLLTLPLMLFILPCLFIVMIGPVIINVIDTMPSST